MPDPTERSAVRALLLTPQNELLLQRIVEPANKRVFWITPGGGREGDEAPETCLKREVFEETGYTVDAVGPAIWTRAHTFTWDGTTVRQREQLHVVPVPRFEPHTRFMPDDIERVTITLMRWWTLDAIERSPEVFVPGRLAFFLRQLLAVGPPASPIDVGR